MHRDVVGDEFGLACLEAAWAFVEETEYEGEEKWAAAVVRGGSSYPCGIWTLGR